MGMSGNNNNNNQGGSGEAWVGGKVWCAKKMTNFAGVGVLSYFDIPRSLILNTTTSPIFTSWTALFKKRISPRWKAGSIDPDKTTTTGDSDWNVKFVVEEEDRCGGGKKLQEKDETSAKHGNRSRQSLFPFETVSEARHMLMNIFVVDIYIPWWQTWDLSKSWAPKRRSLPSLALERLTAVCWPIWIIRDAKRKMSAGKNKQDI